MSVSHNFVDEAGDTTLFGSHGKVLVGTDQASKFFIVGRLEVMDPAALEADLAGLRTGLLVDPLLRTIPSMQASAKKTALFFHAKDDAPEVRHAVFRVLLEHDLRFSAVVREKHHLLVEARKRQAADPAYRYKANGHEIYDELIAKLFGRFGEFGAERHITFAVRGTKPRTAVLKGVLDTIDEGFKADFGFDAHGHTAVQSGYPSKSAGLQACDYLLWALQRFYERQEDRFLQAMWPKFVRVLDLDSPVPKTKGKPVPGGVEFNEKHPLTLQSRAGVWDKDREI